MASYKQLSKYNWKVQVYLGEVEGKKDIVAKQGFRTKSDAKAWADKVENERKNKPKEGELLLKDFIMEWFNDRKLKTLSINARNNNLSRINYHIIPSLGDMKLNEIKTADVQKFYNQLVNEMDLAASSAKKVMETLNGCLKYALKLEYINKLPTDIEKNTIITPDIEYWSKEECSYYLKSIEGQYLYTPVLIALYTGLRVAEICGLKWSDYDSKKGLLSITHQVVQDKKTKQLVFTDILKTSKSYRVITIPDKLIGHLEDIRRDINPKNNDFIVPDRNGFMANPRNVSTNFSGTLEKFEKPADEYEGRIKDYMQLRQITFHGLRHTHASLLILAGEDIKVISERLGHASVKVTYDTYVHIFQEMRKKTSKLLNDLF